MKMTIQMDNPTNSHYNTITDWPRRGRRQSTPEAPEQSRGDAAPAAKLFTENVRILKRGEPLTAFLPERSDLSSKKDRVRFSSRSLAGRDLLLGSTDRVGPDPETVRKELLMTVPGKAYASGSYVTSPHPSLVPIPGFLSGAARGGAAIANHGLRRLLGVGLA